MGEYIIVVVVVVVDLVSTCIGYNEQQTLQLFLVLGSGKSLSEQKTASNDF